MNEKTQKFLIALVVVLLVGLIAEGVYLDSLNKRVKDFEARPVASDTIVISKKPYNALDYFSRRRPGYWDNFWGDEWDPLPEMRRMEERMNKIFGEGFNRSVQSRGFSSSANNFFIPDIDLKEEDTHYVIKMDLPGMDKDKISVEIKGRALVISGERKSVIEDKDGDKLRRQEINYGSFSRQIPLPSNIKEDDVAADYKDGVLTVKIGRTEKPEESKKVQVL